MNKQKRELYSITKEIQKNEQEELECLQRLDVIRKNKELLKNQKRDKGIVCYSKSERENIFIDAKKSGYSSRTLADMNFYLDDSKWNQDYVTHETIESIIMMETYIKEYSPDHNKIKSFIEKLGRAAYCEAKNDN